MTMRNREIDTRVPIDKLRECLSKRRYEDQQYIDTVNLINNSLAQVKHAYEVSKRSLDCKESEIYKEMLINRSYLWLNTKKPLNIRGVCCNRFTIFYEDENGNKNFCNLISKYNKGYTAINVSKAQNGKYCFEVEDELYEYTCLKPVDPEFGIYELVSLDGDIKKIKIFGFCLI